MQPSLNNIQAVAFDLDGTLVDSLQDLSAAANAMLEAMNLPGADIDTVRAGIGDGTGILVTRLLTPHGRLNEWEEGMAHFLNYYSAHLTDTTVPFAGVIEGLTQLRQMQLPLVVITNKMVQLTNPILDRLGLTDYFSLILGGDSLSNKKPEPDQLLHACSALGVLPAELLMVGDSHNDILAARAAGSAVVGVDYGLESMQTLSQSAATRPDFVVHSIVEIADRLGPKAHHARAV